MSTVKRFKRNTVGRDLVVGDIHGYYTKLLNKLKSIGFDSSKDRLFSVGDLIDRGPESPLVAEWLAKDWFHAVQGNHETIIQSYVNIPPHQWGNHGVEWFYDLTQDDRKKYAALLKPLPLVLEVDTANGKVGIIHAECLHRDWNLFIEAIEEGKGSTFRTAVLCCTWSRERYLNKDETPVDNIHAIVVGHSRTKGLMQLGNHYYIDSTSGKPEGEFTILDLNTLEPV